MKPLYREPQKETKIMSMFRVTISGKGLQRSSVEKMAKSFQDKFGPETNISVDVVKNPTSRSARFEQAMQQIENAEAEIESLKDELQEWYDNLPENFQNGDKGETIQTAIDELDTIVSELNDLSGREVEFPGMY